MRPKQTVYRGVWVEISKLDPEGGWKVVLGAGFPSWAGWIHMVCDMELSGVYLFEDWFRTRHSLGKCNSVRIDFVGPSVIVFNGIQPRTVACDGVQAPGTHSKRGIHSKMRQNPSETGSGPWWDCENVVRQSELFAWWNRFCRLPTASQVLRVVFYVRKCIYNVSDTVCKPESALGSPETPNLASSTRKYTVECESPLNQLKRISNPSDEKWTNEIWSKRYWKWKSTNFNVIVLTLIFDFWWN